MQEFNRVVTEKHEFEVVDESFLFAFFGGFGL